jgi:GT2 family glycosyltransferase
MSLPVRLFAVIGLYQKTPSESASFQSLMESCSQLRSDKGNISILLYDNSPNGKPLGELPPCVCYHTTGQNEGLANAFNFALARACQENREWLVTLDQDTKLPPHFLIRIAEIADEVNNRPEIAAIVPQIIGDDRILSPNWFWAGAIPRWFPKNFIGVPKERTFAFNSASTLRVSALREIGGYCPWFWLDHCDSFLYHELNRIEKKVFVAGDLQVDHNFSMLDIDTRMSVSRYHNMLLAEAAFWDLAMSPLARMERIARLFGRLCKYAMAGRNPAFREETALALKRQLFCSKTSRLVLWRNAMLALRPSLTNVPEPFGYKKSGTEDALKQRTTIG